MTQTPTTPPAQSPLAAAVDVNGGRIVDVSLRAEMSTAYMDYAMTVIKNRALPDVRDGLKPVHRRVLWGMYDGGYRPDRGYFKSARIVGDVMGQYHPHGDTAIYDTLVRMAQPWSLRCPLVDGNGNFGSQGDDGAAAPRYTEAKMTNLAMELMRDIDESSVDFVPNYDGRQSEPSVLPARFPNLLVNGSGGIAVGMATNIPPANLIEVNDAVQWALANPTATQDELLDAAMTFVKGPDFPTGATIAGRTGIEDAYRTGRGSIRMRGRAQIEEIHGRQCIVITDLPYQVNKDELLRKITALVTDGKINGIADLNDEGSSRVGMRLVVTLKRDAVAKVVLNNLYKHTDLQKSFGANMVAIVDGVPRTLNLAQFINHWLDHQMEVIARRTQHRYDKAFDRDHILVGLLKALDALDAVIATIRKSNSTEEARDALIALLGIDEVQARAILEMQLRRLAALEAQKITDEHTDLAAKMADYQDILASPDRQRTIISEELAEIVTKYGTERVTEIVGFDGDLNAEDFIPVEDMVVTITRGGYAKRTRSDQYRSQKRGGKGVKGAALRSDDIVDHFFVTSTHDRILFFTNQGRVYRAKAYELAEGGRDAKGQHVANILGFAEGETIAQVLNIANYQAADYLVLATRNGLVKKTALSEYDTRMSGGIIAVNLRDGDELVSAGLASDGDDLILVSAKGQAARFTASNDALRPMSRNTSGVTGMRFRDGDHLLTMLVIAPDETGDVFVATAGGYAKRTPVTDYPAKGRGGLGVIVAKTDEDRGDLVGATLVGDGDEIFAITAGGGVIRTPISTVRSTGRNTLGVRLINLKGADSVLSIARNPEGADDDTEVGDGVDAGEGVQGADVAEVAETAWAAWGSSLLKFAAFLGVVEGVLTVTTVGTLSSRAHPGSAPRRGYCEV